MRGHVSVPKARQSVLLLLHQDVRVLNIHARSGKEAILFPHVDMLQGR